MRKSYDQLLNSLEKSGKLAKWSPGMRLQNANGAVDPSALGYQYAIQTTTLIRAHVVEQKFYEVPIAEFMPTIVGEGAYLEDVKTNIVYHSAGDFESGLQGTGQQSRIQKVDAGIAPVTYNIGTWVGGYQYSILELEKALASDNWNVVESKQKVLKKEWDLGIQKVAFLGTLSDPTGKPGLLTNANVTIDLTTIASNISSMNATDFAAFVAAVIQAYFANSNSTVYPDTFAMPTSDYNGMAVLVPGTVGTFPVSKLAYLKQAFMEITGNANFKILPLAYGDAANNAGYINGASGKYRYCLYRQDPDTLLMDIPLDFQLRAPMSGDNFNFNGVALGQFTGVQIYRVPEVIYFDHS